MSLKKKLFEEMFSTFATVHPTQPNQQKLNNLDPTRPNLTHPSLTHGSTQHMDNCDTHTPTDTHRHAHHNTSLPYGDGGIIKMIGRRITTITEYTRETTFLFQRLSMALQRGNAVSFHNTMVTE